MGVEQIHILIHPECFNLAPIDIRLAQVCIQGELAESCGDHDNRTAFFLDGFLDKGNAELCSLIAHVVFIFTDGDAHSCSSSRMLQCILRGPSFVIPQRKASSLLGWLLFQLLVERIICLEAVWAKKGAKSRSRETDEPARLTMMVR